MIQSDALSQRPNHGKEKQVLLPEDLFINLLDIDLQNQILDEGPTNMQNDLADWKIEGVDGQRAIFYKAKNYIPKDQELQHDIVKMFHDHETAGHPGELKT